MHRLAGAISQLVAFILDLDNNQSTGILFHTTITLSHWRQPATFLQLIMIMTIAETAISHILRLYIIPYLGALGTGGRADGTKDMPARRTSNKIQINSPTTTITLMCLSWHLSRIKNNSAVQLCCTGVVCAVCTLQNVVVRLLSNRDICLL